MKKKSITKVIGIGVSTGGIDALNHLFRKIENVSIPMIITQHRHVNSDDSYVDIFKKGTDLKISEVFDKLEIMPKTIYFAPSDYHLLVDLSPSRKRFIFSLSKDEPLEYARPSINIFFESIADIFKKQAIGILLSGSLNDGARGLAMIKEKGGMTIVQDPKEAFRREMPEAAIAQRKPDYILTLSEIAQKIVEIDKKGD